MAEILHLRCSYCGDRLVNNQSAYCPDCNLYLCYRAMPILLGMLMTSELQETQSKMRRIDFPLLAATCDHDDEPCIMVPYSSAAPLLEKVSAYEEELCIMVSY